MKKKTLITLVSIFVLVLVVGLASCAPQEGTEEENKPEESAGNSTPSTTIEFSMESDCAACHANEKASFEDGKCLAAKHTTVTCITCHDDASMLTSVHESADLGGKMPKRLKQTEISNTTCLACHEGSIDALIGATPDIVVTDSAGNSYNPHNPPESPAHAEDIPCYSCHKMHAESNIAEDGKRGCINCHHTDVFECGTCHAVE